MPLSLHSSTPISAKSHDHPSSWEISTRNLWFTEYQKLGRISIGGTIVEFDPLAMATYDGETANPDAITNGPDGNVWFTIQASSGIGYFGSISPNGVVANYAFSGAVAPHSNSITTGADGNLWLTENLSAPVSPGNVVFVATAAGTLQSIALPNQAVPSVIAPGPDGAMWVVLDSGGIDRISVKRTVTETSLPQGVFVHGVTTGADGNLWLTTDQGLARMTTNGSVTTFPWTDNPDHAARRITSKPDGDLWFTAYNGGLFGRIDLSGTITTFIPPSTIDGISLGPDGNIWFTEPDVSKIGRFVPP